MFQHLVKLALTVAGVVAAGVVIDGVVRHFTHQSLAQHLSNWIAPLRDAILTWAHNNPQHRIRAVVLRAVRMIDNVVSAAARVEIKAFVQVGDNAVPQEAEVTSTVMTVEEALNMGLDETGELKLQAT